MSRILKPVIFLLLFIVASGCPFAHILGDRLAYKFQGTIFSSLDHQQINNVRVKAACEKTRLDPPLETLTDEKGLFTLHGYFSGSLDDCELIFEHPQFKRKVVKLQPARELKADTGFMRIWTIDIELEPK